MKIIRNNLIKLPGPGPVHAIAVKIGKAFFIDGYQYNFVIGIFLLKVSELVVEDHSIYTIKCPRIDAKKPYQKEDKCYQ
jgi:hypothetical protein